MRSGEDGGAVQRRIERRIRRQREEKEESGDAQQESDELVQTPVPGGRKNLRERCHVAATALLAKSLPHSAVTRPEPDNYGKKRRFLQCGERDGVASWVRGDLCRRVAIDVWRWCGYLAGADSSSPRCFSIALALGGAPRQFSYILARSSVFPRERTIWRKRSPLARVSPPCSSNHW